MYEKWKDIKGFEGIYQISNLGNLRSLDRYVNNNGGTVLKRGNILKPFINGSGYYQCNLYLNNNKIQPYLHKLVAEAFIDNPNNLKEVNHIDHNKLNCKVENLEWCTRQDNMIECAKFYGTKRIEKYCKCGEAMHRESTMCDKCSRISSRKVKDRPSKEELLYLITSKSFLEIGRMYNVSDNTIRKWCKSYNLPYRKKDFQYRNIMN